MYRRIREIHRRDDKADSTLKKYFKDVASCSGFKKSIFIHISKV